MNIFSNMKNRFNSGGMTLLILKIVLAIITVLAHICYAIFYKGTSSFSIYALICLGIAVVFELITIFIDNKVTKYIQFGLSLASLCFFCYGIYYYVSVVFVGIDLDHFSFEFIFESILLLLNFLLNIVILFIPNNEEKEVKSIRIVKPICAALTTIFALVHTAYVITDENKLVITKALGQKDYVIKDNSGNKDDTEYYKSKYNDLNDLINNGKSLVEEVELNGCVLLKNNESTLPLAKHSNISLFSLGSISPAYGGSGSSSASKPLPPADFKTAFTNSGLNINNTLFSFYKSKESKYKPVDYMINDVPWNEISANSDVTASFSTFNDAAIVVLKRVRGEHNDPAFASTSCDGENGNYLALNQNEKDLFENLASLKGTTFKKIIVILNSPNQLETDFLDNEEYKIDAAMWAGTLGVTGCNAIGKLIVGDATPSGKLSDTYWKKHCYNPIMANFGSETYSNSNEFSDLPKKTGTDSYTSMQYDKYVAYQEGIYVGYRYAETRYYDVCTGRNGAGDFNYSNQISYPFGYGLSYTNFEYSNFKVEYDSINDSYITSVDVKNIGNTYSGREAVQFYLNKPYTEYDIQNHIEKSVVDLVGYAKTKNLAPNESQTVSTTIEKRELASYDAYGKGTYILDAGDYYLTCAKNAHAATNNLLSMNGFITSDGNPTLVKKIETIHSIDDKTYSSSKNTKYKIKNLFDEMDMNRYANRGENHIEYMTRNNWKESVPSTADDTVVLKLTRGMVDDIISQESSDFIAPDEIPYPNYGKNNNLQLIDMRIDSNGEEIPFDSESWDDFMDQFTWDEIASLITTGMRKTGMVVSHGKPSTVEHNGPTGLTEKYISGTSGIAFKINDQIGYKDYTDMENMSGYSPVYYPCLNILASTFDEEIASRVGEMMGEDALWAGYNGFYGVGVNIHRTAYDGRNFEYYSEDGFLTGKQASNLTKSLQKKGCNAYVKHIAGYEQQEYRVGLNVWCNEQAYREVYLKPFKMVVEDGHAMNAMSSYTRVGVKLCPISYSLVTEFLRNECGMKGFVVSDMWKNRYLDKQLPNCLMGGCDLPDGDFTNGSIYDQFKEGYGAVAQQMRLAAKRICYATVHSNAMNDVSSNTRIIAIRPLWQKIVIGVDIAFAVLSASSIGLCAYLYLRKRGYKNEK